MRHGSKCSLFIKEKQISAARTKKHSSQIKCTRHGTMITNKKLEMGTSKHAQILCFESVVRSLFQTQQVKRGFEPWFLKILNF